MSIDYSAPSMILCDETGVPIPGVSKSRAPEEAMEKASKLGNGTYKLERPPATIVVDQEAVVPPPPSGLYHYQRISAEIELA